MADFKLEDDRLRDYKGGEYGKVDSDMTVWGTNSRAGYIDKDGSYISEDGRYLGQVWTTPESKPKPSTWNPFTRSGSSSSTENFWIGILLTIIFILLFIVVIILLTPIMTPIFLSNAESARKRRDKSEFDKWNGWTTITGIVAVLVVLGVASFIGINVFSISNNFLSHLEAGFFTAYMLPISITVAFITFLLLLITGMAPTSMVILRHREIKLRTVGNIKTANRLRRVNWATGIVAGCTIVLSIVLSFQLNQVNPTTSYVTSNSNPSISPSVSGSGNVISQTREISGFDSIKVEYPAQIFISQGNAESIKIEAEDNILPGLQTTISGRLLDIYYKDDEGIKVNPTQNVKITIVVNDLKEIQFDSAGELIFEGLETDKLEVTVNGAGNIKLNEITVNNIYVNLRGAGSMSTSGTAENLHLTISGFGSFNAGELHSQVANVNLSGAGSATLWVDETLNATISGAGSINYYGDAKVTRSVTGVGDIKRLGSK
jgi:hypothetical protein